MTLEPSILAFAKKPIFSAQVLDRQVQGRKIPIFVYVRYQSEGTYILLTFPGLHFLFSVNP